MAMHGLWMCGFLLAVEVGWQPLPEGDGMEYLIQLSPKDLEAMQLGEPWRTDIPPSVGNVRSYRISVGTESLPRVAPPPSLPPQEQTSPAGESVPRPLSIGPNATPLPEKRAVFMTPGQEEDMPLANGEEPSATEQVAKSEDVASRPWMLLVAIALALAGSLSGNAYLFWALREAHHRYRELAAGLSDSLNAQ